MADWFPNSGLGAHCEKLQLLGNCSQAWSLGASGKFVLNRQSRALWPSGLQSRRIMAWTRLLGKSLVSKRKTTLRGRACGELPEIDSQK
ncbi:hypothetical protein JOD69_003776 [Methylocaldum sp. RMAD-M]|nr:hypothetical protein [Methylocaldum sp. RMAD-M]